MATRTISNSGGNWNSIGTWVEGAVPVNGDNVVATATSGQVTVTAAAACTTMVLTGYTNTLTINNTFTLTVAGNITLATGMTVAGSGTLFQSAGGTLTSNGVSLNSCSLILGTLNQGRTFADNWTVNNFALTLTSLISSSTIFVNGNLSVTGNSNAANTTVFEMIGTGVVSTGAGTIRNDLRFANGSNVTINSNVNINDCTITNVSGSVVTTTGSTLTITASTIFNTNGITWNNIIVTIGTITINSLLTINGTLTLASTGTVNFNGTSGFNTNTFICITAGRTINYLSGITYNVTNSITVTGTTGSKINFISSSTGALFNIQVGATQAITFCNATWINSSGGQTVNVNEGTLTNTINWSVGDSTGNMFLMF